MIMLAKAVAQRRTQQSRAGRCTDHRERLYRELHGPRSRPFSDHNIELEVLHRRIENLFDHSCETMDLVDEQYVTLIEIVHDCGKIACTFDRRPRGYPQVDTELTRDDMSQRGLAEAGRSGKQNVIERLAAYARRLDRHRENLPDALLSDEFGERART